MGSYSYKYNIFTWLQDMVNKVVPNVQWPTISLSSPQAWNYELGSIVNVILNATYTKHTYDIITMSFKRDGWVINTQAAWPWSWTKTFTDNWLTSNVQTSFVYSATVTDNHSSAGTSNNVTVTFLPLVWRGANVNESLTESDIEALAHSAMKSGRDWDYAYQTDLWKYKYLCYPDTFGQMPDPTMNIIDTSTGFPVPFALIGSVPTTNSHWAAITYLVYKSVYPLGWAQTLRLSV